jgi:pyruvate dehydrogenase E1 component
MAIYQARFLKYLQGRDIASTADRHVWAFLGDGECDEPESLGAISLAGREHLDNLIFVINCNLQRLDGPVRGNGKIIQELEGVFRGAGWNVIKVIWGSNWDPLLARDTSGCYGSGWRSASTASTRTSSPRTAPTYASTSSASTRAARAWLPT